MEKRRCADCVKWEYEGDNWGKCKAHAPRPGILRKEGPRQNFILVWPSTGADDWCWEFEKGMGESIGNA